MAALTRSTRASRRGSVWWRCRECSSWRAQQRSLTHAGRTRRGGKRRHARCRTWPTPSRLI
eukprot:2311900-Pleurochrysis_carterae.AAC.1